MCDGYDDATTVWIDEWLRARRPRDCCACGEAVPIGAIYHMHKTLTDGQWLRWDHCARCWRMCLALWNQSSGDAIDLHLACGAVWSDPPPQVAALAFETPAEMQAHAEREYREHKRETAP